MELRHFLEGIRMMPEAIRAVMELQIPEEEYQKNRALFRIDKDGFSAILNAGSDVWDVWNLKRWMWNGRR